MANTYNSIKRYVWSSTFDSNEQFLAPTALAGRESSDIKVKVGKTELTNSQFSLTNNFVKFNTGFTPNVGDTIRIYRQTGHTGRLVDFVDGSLLTSETLDLDSNQLFNMAEEAYEKGDETTVGSESFYYTGDEPTAPATGTLWYDTSSQPYQLKVWSGTDWEQTASAKSVEYFTSSDIAPWYPSGSAIDDGNGNTLHFASNSGYTSASNVYLNGVKLKKAQLPSGIPTDGDYYYDSVADKLGVQPLSSGDELTVENFSSSFSSAVLNSEAAALSYKNQAGQSASGAAQSAGQALDYRGDALDYASDATKYAINPKDQTFTTSNGTGGQYSARHYAETAADSATTASSAANNTQVQTVGTDLALGSNSKIKQVADDIDDVTAVAGKLTEVDALAGKTSEMTTLTTGTALSDINTVAGKATEVGQVAAIDSEIADVALKLSEIDAVEAKLSDIEDVAEVATKVSDVATAIPDITTVATEPYKSKIETVYTHRDTITDVGGEITKVTTVANDLTGANNIGTLADPTYKQQVTDVANQIGAVGTVSASINNNDISTVVSNVENIGTVADISDDVTNLSKSTGDMSTLVSKLGQTNDLAGAVNDAQASATAAAGSASTATTQATAAAGSASTAATHAANLGSVAYQDLTAIAESKSVSAADVFVYDTSKDSDGGAWRNRTQGTSWYNEALNTSTRGATKKFPAVAVIVVVTNKVIIYDGDDPSMPLWMQFDNQTSVGLIKGSQKTSVTARDGSIFLGTLDGLFDISFIKDLSFWYTGSTSYGGYYKGNIAQRQETFEYQYQGVQNSSVNIAHSDVNDVAVTVLPNAPIDPDTGLPVPTIAVATESGVSVIKDDGNVANLTRSGGQRHVGFVGEHLTATRSQTVDVFNKVSDLPSGTYADWTVRLKYFDAGQVPSINRVHSSVNDLTVGDSLAVASNIALSRLALNHENYDKSMVNYITSSYNTGWMNGDIKLATLMDTTAETISAPELVTNGDFSSFGSNMITNGEFPNDANGWSLGSDFTWDNSGRVERTSGSINSSFSQNITIEDGKTYKFSVDVTHTSGDTHSTVFIDYGDGYRQYGLYNSGTLEGYFTAVGDSTMPFQIYGINDFRGYFDNVVVQEITGWKATDGNPDVSIDSNGRLKMETNATDGWQAVYNYFDTEVGKKYAVTATVESASGNVGEAHFRGSSGAVSIHHTGLFHRAIPSGTSQTFTLTFTAANVRTNVHLMTQINNTVYLDNVSVVELEPDRSVNDNGLNINGNIVKSAVATGAELMGYGFSPSPFNNLKVLYDSDHASLGSYWTFMTWVKRDTTAGWDFLLSLDGANSTHGSGIRFDSDQSIAVCPVGGHADPTRAETNSTVAGNDLAWQMLAIVCDGQRTYFYRNGKLLETVNKAPSLSLPDSSYYFTVGAENEHSTGGPVDGRSKNMALLRLSASQATPEQIAKIYRDEKPLFQEGAKCTLYGDYDEVKALAYDEDTEILHAGTTGGGSSLRGRSDFKGLQRVDNTTYGVAVALSAANGLVVEE